MPILEIVMKALSTVVLSLCLLFTATSAVAQGVVSDQRIRIPSVSLIISQQGNANADGTSESRFCCKNENGRSCHVFGDASCTNCTSFCEGSMVVDPQGGYSY